jgi:hypothetical protein
MLAIDNMSAELRSKLEKKDLAGVASTISSAIWMLVLPAKDAAEKQL